MINRLRRPFQLLLKNLSSVLIALALAFSIWIIAVLDADPNEERNLPGGVTLTIQGLNEDYIVTSSIPTSVDVRLRAPESVWEQLSEQDIVTAHLDLSGLVSGSHIVPVVVEVGATPVRILEIFPAAVELQFESFVTREFEISPIVNGEPALGFVLDDLTLNSQSVTVSGPESQVDLVDHVRVVLDVSGSRESLTNELNVLAYSVEGTRLTNVEIEPRTVIVNQIVSQAGGYRDLAVKVETIGLLASGYRVTNILVNPLTVTVFSSDPELVAALPGFVSTQPLDLTNANSNIEQRLALILPEGVSVVGDEQNVLVSVGVAGIETSITLSVTVETIGLGSELGASISPETVDIILTGPLPVLDKLTDEDVRVFVDLTDLAMGTHLLVPQVEILPEQIVVESISPASIEVIIGPAFTPTPDN